MITLNARLTTVILEPIDAKDNILSRGIRHFKLNTKNLPSVYRILMILNDNLIAILKVDTFLFFGENQTTIVNFLLRNGMEITIHNS